MHPQTKRLLLLTAILITAALTWAQQAGTTEPTTVTITLGITDDRWIKSVIAPDLTDSDAWEGMTLGYFTRDKTSH